MKLPVFILQDLLNPDLVPDVFLTFSEAMVAGREMVAENHTGFSQQGVSSIAGITVILYGQNGHNQENVCSIIESKINLNKNKMYDLMNSIETNLHKTVKNGEAA